MDEFTESVTKENITVSEVKSLVCEKAKLLWDSAVNQVQSGNLDDRPLYWARNKMQAWLKRNSLFKDQIDYEKSIVKKELNLKDLLPFLKKKVEIIQELSLQK